MKNFILWIAMAALPLFFVTSCEKNEPDDPIIPNEEEVITTLNFTLIPIGVGNTVVLSFQDLDGNGGSAPTISGGILDTNTTYTGSLELLNELESPALDITEEVQNEAEEHQFFFQTSIDGMNIIYDDMDANGNPIGLSTLITTNGASAGSLTVILRHEPDKNASGVSIGDITNAGGETDIEIVFDVVVE